MALSTALAMSIMGLLDVDVHDVKTKGDRVIYTYETDTLFKERAAGFKAKVATMFDLPLKWGKVEKAVEIQRGHLVKTYHVEVSVPKVAGLRGKSPARIRKRKR